MNGPHHDRIEGQTASGKSVFTRRQVPIGDLSTVGRPPLVGPDLGEGAVMGHAPDSLADVHRYAWDETRAAALVVAVFLAWSAVAVGLGYHFGRSAGKRDAVATLQAIGALR